MQQHVDNVDNVEDVDDEGDNDDDDDDSSSGGVDVNVFKYSQISNERKSR